LKKKTTRLTHLAPDGAARMVDVSKKRTTLRTASARAVVTLPRKAFAALDAAENAKGDALAVARLAGIQAAKRTPEWIPLCHPVPFDAVSVSLAPDAASSTVEIRAEIRGTAKTGFEMEALTAASAAALALYDMCKSADKGIVIGPVELVSKTGGKSGAWRRGSK
jgi:cyclic pyranopterin phosphate synthase